MSKEIAILTLHGMGKTKRDYADGLREELADELGKETWSQVHFEPIFIRIFSSLTDLPPLNQSRSAVRVRP